MKDLRQLPGPKGNFFLGNALQLNKDLLGFITHCAEQYGDIVPLRLGLTPACLIKKPEYIEQILQKRELFVKNTPDWRTVRTIVGQGLATSEGDFWLRQRRMIQPVFHQQRINAYAETMVHYTKDLLLSWKEGEIRDIHEDMMNLTLNIVTKTILDLELSGTEGKIIADCLHLAMEWFASQQKQGYLQLFWLPTPINLRYQNALKKMDRLIYELIRQRRAKRKDIDGYSCLLSGDLLAMLMEVVDSSDGTGMSERQLRDELVTLMLTGHETTANLLSWTFMLLCQNPSVQAKLILELETVLGNCLPNTEDLNHLRYTQQVIKESLRLYPTLYAIPRCPIRDCEIGGYTFPAGCFMIVSPWVMQRSSSYFANPEQFQPERWANNLEKELPKGVYFPFGEGPRSCIGKGFAMMEATLLLATIVQKFKLELLSEPPIVPFPSITLRPKYGIKVLIHSSLYDQTSR